jgi:hypothetical protein
MASRAFLPILAAMGKRDVARMLPRRLYSPPADRHNPPRRVVSLITDPFFEGAHHASIQAAVVTERVVRERAGDHHTDDGRL